MADIIKIRAISSLEKLYYEDKITQQELTQFSMLRNEKKSFQVAFETQEECELQVTVSSTIKTL